MGLPTGRPDGGQKEEEDEAMTPIGSDFPRVLTHENRIDKATDILLESMSIYEADKMRKRVVDAFYLLMEGKERGA